VKVRTSGWRADNPWRGEFFEKDKIESLTRRRRGLEAGLGRLIEATDTVVFVISPAGNPSSALPVASRLGGASH
jgi:hypothetical protein